MTRSEARKNVLELLFEREFRRDENDEEIFALSCEAREIEADDYIKSSYFGVCRNIETLDNEIDKNAKGWKSARLSKISRSILRLCIYEMLYVDDIPARVSINEALDLCREFDEDKARPFVNGVLNAVMGTLPESKEK